MRPIISIALFLIALVACTYSHTKCYVCSDVGGSCADRYSISSHEQDCSDWGFLDDGGCSKYKHRIKVLGTWLISTTRFCGQAYDNSQCEQKDRLNENVLGIRSEGWYCSCEGAKCNSGSQLAFSSVLIVSVLAKFVL